MVRIVCQVLQKPDQVTFIWSQGNSSFEPYHLYGDEAERFYELGQKAREKLAEVFAGQSSPASLAQTGHALFRAIFRMETDGASGPRQVMQWLQAQETITSLEIVSDVPGRIPWNVVYGGDLQPEPDFRNFWSVRYPLAVGRRVNPIRLNPVIADPSVLLILDPVGPQEHYQAWQKVAKEHSWNVVASLDQFSESLRLECPDVLCFVGGVEENCLSLAEEKITFAELRTWIDEAEAGNPEPLLLLASSPLSAPPSSLFLQQAALTFPGLIAWEESPPAELAGTLGLSCLEKLLQSPQPLVKALQEWRQSQGWAALGLSCFCPPSVRFGGEAEDSGTLYEIPETPFRPLKPYDQEDRPLFAGRDQDICRFTRLLDEPDSRLILLHGVSGVGKSSFLRAGVVPFLEDDSQGYLVLRDRTPDEAMKELEYPLLAIRASRDLAGQLAEALCVFCAQPFSFETPLGNSVTVPLPDILREFLRISSGDPSLSTAIQEGMGVVSPDSSTGIQDPDQKPSIENEEAAAAVLPVELYLTLADDPANLSRLLEAITQNLPRELVILIEQGEELITQARDEDDHFNRRQALEMLDQLGTGFARCKVVMALRTDYLGRLVNDFPPHSLQEGEKGGWRDFYLGELDRSQILEAVMLPTAREDIPFTSQIPHQKYQVSFQTEFAHQLVDEVMENAQANRQSVLSLLQVVCDQLYQRARKRRISSLSQVDLKDIGGVDGALVKLAEFRLKSLSLSRDAKKGLRNLIFHLCTTHPDGSLTRDTLSTREIQQTWRGKNVDDVQNVLGAAEGAGLLEIQQLLVGGREDIFVSLAQDSLVQVPWEWAEQKKRQALARTKVIDTLWITIPLIFLAAALTFYFARHNFNAEMEKFVAQAVKEEAKLKDLGFGMLLPQYLGQVVQAEQAWHGGNLVRMRQLLLSQQYLATGLGEEEKDLRGFEWHYLWRLANSERHLLAGHAAPVNAVAVSVDSRLAASAGNEGKMFVWDLKTGQKLATCQGHLGAIHAVVFSGDGKTLVSAGADKTIRLWDISGLKDKHIYLDKPARILEGHGEMVRALVLHQNFLASAGDDKTLILWDLDKGTPRQTLKDHAGPIHALAFSAPGKILASGGEDGLVLLWDADTGKKLHSIEVSKGPIRALAFSPDGKTLVSGSSEPGEFDIIGSLRTWDPTTGKPRSQEPGARYQVRAGAEILALAFSPDGKTLISGGKDNFVHFWDAANFKEIGKIKGHLGWIRSLAFTPDGQSLITGSYDATVKVWDPRPNEGSTILHTGDSPMTTVAFAPGDMILAAGGKEGNVYLWEPATGKLLDTIKGFKGAITSVVFSPEVKKTRMAVAAVSGKDEGEIKIFELDLNGKGKLAGKTLFSLNQAADCLAFTPDGNTLAFGGAGNNVGLWEPAKDAKARELEGHAQPVRSLAFTRDGKFLASGGADHAIRLWSVRTGASLSTSPILGHTGPVLALAFRPDNMLLSGSADQTFKIWLPDEGKEMATFRNHVGPVTKITPDALEPATAFTASADHTIKIWHTGNIVAVESPGSKDESKRFILKDQGERFTLKGHTAPVRSLALTADGQTLASAAEDGTVRLWRAGTRK